MMRDEKGPDEKIRCLPLKDSYWNHIRKLSDVLPHLLEEIDHFFSIQKSLKRKR